MNLIQPFRGLRPTKEFVSQVIAPPYDVLNSAEASERAKNKPYSFLHISKPEIDLPENMNIYDEKVYQKGAENFSNLINKKILVQDDNPHYYIYRLTCNGRHQTGLVATASVAAYRENRIRKHEQTQPAKVIDRTKQITALAAQTGPVFLAYKNEAKIAALLKKITLTNVPEFDVTADDGVQHQLWLIDNPEMIATITDYFNNLSALYIADGHHRAEAAAAVAATNDNPLAQYFLTVIFPDQELNILGYYRVIKDLNYLTPAELLEKTAANFTVTPITNAQAPTAKGTFSMFLRQQDQGQWYQLEFKGQPASAANAQENLDVSILANYILAPLLNIQDPRRNPRIEFVGGIRGLGELEKRVNSGEMAAAFALFPTQMQEVMQIADANQFMPPKSTWFEPKLADGLISYLLN